MLAGQKRATAGLLSQHADEGEGFADIDDWRRAHRRYWASEAALDVADDEPVVCLRFEVLSS